MRSRCRVSVALAQDAKPIAIGKSLVDGSIRIEVEELKRTGDGTVMLKIALINDSLRDLPFDFLGAATDRHLVDLVNRRQYGVGMQDTGQYSEQLLRWRQGQISERALGHLWSAAGGRHQA